MPLKSQSLFDSSGKSFVIVKKAKENNDRKKNDNNEKPKNQV